MTDAYAHALDSARKELAQIEDRKRERIGKPPFSLVKA